MHKIFFFFQIHMKIVGFFVFDHSMFIVWMFCFQVHILSVSIHTELTSQENNYAKRLRTTDDYYRQGKLKKLLYIRGG